MAVQDSNLHDELLPEIEITITPSKLSENVRVDLFRFADDFMHYLEEEEIIEVGADVIMMPISKFPKFSQSLRDAYRKYQLRHANV